MLVKQLTSLGVDGIITKWMLRKQLVVTWKVVNNDFFKISFLQNDHYRFLEDVEFILTDKT